MAAAVVFKVELSTTVVAELVSMVHTEVGFGGGGKKSPLESGRGRVGPEPDPTALPTPGKLVTTAAVAAAAAALAA